MALDTYKIFRKGLLGSIVSLPAGTTCRQGTPYKRNSRHSCWLGRHPLNLSFRNNPNSGLTFLLSDRRGRASLKIDYRKCDFKGTLNKDGPLSEYLFSKGAFLASFLAAAVRMHCAWVKKGRVSFLLIGASGAGKSTLAKLWLEGDKGSSLLEEDSMFVTVPKDPIGLSLLLDVKHPISHLFFIERNKSAHSKIRPITVREAFLRIVYHSDIIFKNRRFETCVQQRVNILNDLVIRCKSFALINGNDLRENPARLHSFIQNALQSIP